MAYTTTSVSTIRFDHIAIAVPRMAEATPFLVGELGGMPTYGAPSGAYRFAQWRFDGGGRLEILEPLGRDGFLHRFLARHGPGVHHVTFRVPRLREACERARTHGYEIVGYDDSNPHWKEAFLHPKQALGIVVQLAETSRGGDGPPRWQPPPGPPDPPPPVTIVGLRLRAQARERAHTQWASVLQGESSESENGRVIYRWPGSPMRISVEIDGAGEEGPVAIELASHRPVSLPAGAHPVLGAVFTPCPAP
jgi:methylmalonyl-CoA/ethylmalonyl-CoA epimerase